MEKASYGELSGRGRKRSKWRARPTESCQEGYAGEASGDSVLLKAVWKGTQKKQVESASYGELSGRGRRRSKCRSASDRELSGRGRRRSKWGVRPTESCLEGDTKEASGGVRSTERCLGGDVEEAIGDSVLLKADRKRTHPDFSLDASDIRQ